MPQPIANNILATPISGSIERAAMSLAIEGQDRDYGNNYSGLDWYSSITPLDGKYVIISKSIGTGLPTHWVTADDTDAELLYTVNRLPAVANNLTFTDTGSALDYLASSDRYIVLRSMPNNSDADALVLSVDASNLSSYPRTGAGWYDLSGYGANGTLINGPTFNSNGWIDFDGTNDYTQIVGTGFQNDVLPSSSYVDRTATFMATVKFDTTANAGAVITRWGNSLGQTWWFGRYGGGGTIHLALDTSTGYKPFFSNSSVGTNTSRFYHIAATVNGGNYTFYNNGEEDGNGTYTGNWDVPPLCPVLLGAQNTGSASLLNGKIASAKVYSRTLSSTEIKQNYFGGPIVTDGLVFAVDPSNLVSYENGSTTAYSLTGSLNGSLFNGVSYRNENGGIFEFDGVDDWIETNYNPTLSGNIYTWECWYWDDSPGAGGAWTNTAIISNYRTATTPLVTLHIENTGGVRYQERNTSGTIGSIFSSNICDGNWHHIVATVNTTTMYLYIDGVLVNTATRPGGTIDSGQNIIVGSNHLSRFTSCKMGPTRMYYNKSFTSDEIQQNYNAQKQKYQL